MTNEDRERAVQLINQHIEEGKQVIRDKRFLIEVLERDYERRASSIRRIWKGQDVAYKLGQLDREIDRAYSDMNLQRSKNSKLRDLRTSIRQPMLAGDEAPLLLTHVIESETDEAEMYQDA